MGKLGGKPPTKPYGVLHFTFFLSLRAIASSWETCSRPPSTRSNGLQTCCRPVPHCSLPQSLPLFGEPFPLPPVSEPSKWKEAKVLIKQSRGSSPCHPTLGNRFLFVLLMGHPVKSFPWIKKPLNNGKLLYFKGL